MDGNDIKLYLVGEDEDEAKRGLIFDTEAGAEDYLQSEYGEGNAKIYSVSAFINFDTIEEV